MKIDLLKMGLTKESTFDEIQTKLQEKDFFTEDEVTKAKNDAASGARKATEAKLKETQGKNLLSDEEIKEYNDYKNDKKKTTLKQNKTLAKLSDDDFELIVKAENLLNSKDEELESVIGEIEKKYAKRFKNDLPPVVEETDKEKEEKVDLEKFSGL